MMKFDVLIVGAGLSGASLACALRGSRLRVGLIERQPPSLPSGWDARIYAISPVNVQFLERCGVWQHIESGRVCAVEQMQVFGDAQGEIDFSAYDAGLDSLACIVESSRMATELWESAKRQSNITVICPATPEQVLWREQGATLTLTDGRVLEADLIVAADGAQSWVREQAGIPADVRPYDEIGVVANFACERSHQNTAFQWFGREGILAYLPLPENKISMVWSVPSALAPALLEASADELCDRVAQAGKHRLGKLSLVTPAAGFPLRWLRVPRVVAPGLALIGDAAHGVHPLSGHGVNLGFADAHALADVLLALPDFCSCGQLSVLERYARSRAEEVRLLQGGTHIIDRLFHAQFAPMSLLRNTGMNAFARLPWVKTALIRYACGLF